MPCSNGKKQKTGHYSNNAHYRRQPNSMFTPGTDVIEKKTSHKYTVLQKYEKAPRSLIRVENKNDGTIRYIRSNLLHTENYSMQIVNNNRSKVMVDKPQRKKRRTACGGIMNLVQPEDEEEDTEVILNKADEIESLQVLKKPSLKVLLFFIRA